MNYRLGDKKKEKKHPLCKCHLIPNLFLKSKLFKLKVIFMKKTAFP